MERTEAAMILAGVVPQEQQQASAPTNLHVITGTIVGNSSEGKTLLQLDGIVLSEDDNQYIEVDTLGGLEEGDVATVLLTGEPGHGLTPLAVGAPGSIDRIDVRIKSIEADYVKATLLEADVAALGFVTADTVEAEYAKIETVEAAEGRIDDLEADNATINGKITAAEGRIGTLEANDVTISGNLTAATGRIDTLEANDVTISGNLTAATGRIDTLETATADIGTIRANSAKVQNLTAAQLEADHATIGLLSTTYATIDNLNAANGRIDNLQSSKANVTDLTAATGRITNLEAADVNITGRLEATEAVIDDLDANYIHTDMLNADVAWLQNGVIKDGAIVNGMIQSVSANKLTAGTIDASNITVTNLNADNITTGTINGQRIGAGSLSLDKLEEDVYTETEVDNIVAGLQTQIDGAIETWTGTDIPTLQNAPAVNWDTNAKKDSHVGDVYFVVNSNSQQNGYNYRFTKSGNTYSWQLIKDSDVTNALARLSTAEGKITTFDSDISTLKTDTGTLKTKTTSLETRMSDAESDILDKVDTTTFNEVSDTVDSHSQSITQMSTTLSNKADNSTVTAVTQRVSKTEQDINGINTTIGSLQTTVESKADGSTVETISSNLNTISNTVDGHTSQLSSITSTQTTIQGSAVKSTVQLWFTKSNTTAPNKPTAHVTTNNASTANAWNLAVPTYNASYPNYFYCYEYEYLNGTYGWSAVTRDIATGEAQSMARTAASDASTAKTNASNAVSTANTANTNASNAVSTANTAASDASTAKTNAASAVSTANTANTNASNAVSTANTANTNASNAVSTANTAKSTADKNLRTSQQLWFTKADSTAPNKPTSKVNSEATTGNAWTTKVPTYNDSYKYYFYCMQYIAADGTVTWSDVIYDQATTEAQSVARTASTNINTLQSDYATFKQTTQQFESTIGTTIDQKVQTGIANLEIGGRNYVRSYNRFKVGGMGSKITCSLTEEGYLRVVAESGNGNYASSWYAWPTVAEGRALLEDNFDEGDPFTISFMVRLVQGTPSKLPTIYIKSGMGYYQLNGEPSSDWVQGWYTGTWHKSNSVEPHLGFSNAVGTWEFKSWQIEHGNKPTAHNPAPEDMDARVTNAETTINQTANNVLIKATETDTTSAQGGQHIIESIINVAPNGVKIAADKVDIEGAAIFTSGRLTNANIVKTVNAVSYANMGFQFKKDIIIYGDSDKYYPVYLNNTQAEYSQSVPHEVVVTRGYSEQAPADWNTSTHKGGLNLRLRWNYGGWGGATYVCQIYDFSELYSKMLGDVLVGNKSGMNSTIYLRGGGTTGAIYHIYSQVSIENTRYGATFPYIGTDEPGTVYMQSGSYTFTVDNPLTTPNTAHILSLAATVDEQYIYISKASGTTSVESTTTWVTAYSDSQNAWTTKRPTYNSSYPVLFVAKQRKTAFGLVTCTTPVKDDTTTVIDGGHITTGTIDTNRLNADTIRSNIVQTTDIQASRVMMMSGEQTQSLEAYRESVSNNIGEMVSNETFQQKIQALDEALEEKLSQEDADTLVNTAISDVEESIANNYVANADLDDAVQTLNDTLSNLGLTYATTEALSELSESLNVTSQDLVQLTSYIYADNVDDGEGGTVPVLFLGSKQSKVQAMLSNNVLNFIYRASADDPGTVVAYIGAEETDTNATGKLYVIEAVVVNEISFGHWSFFERQNHNMAIKWIGE